MLLQVGSRVAAEPSGLYVASSQYLPAPNHNL